jgi:hypothetical protein
MSLPFSAEEKDMFVEYLMTTEKQNAFASEILLIWNVQNAQYSAARDIMQGDGHANEKRRLLREGLEKAT